MEPFTLQSIQKYIRTYDHDPENTQHYFMKLVEEVGELSEVIRKNKRLADSGTIKGTIEEELYDVLYYVLALANLYEIDMEEAMRLKETINREKYQKEKMTDAKDSSGMLMQKASASE